MRCLLVALALSHVLHVSALKLPTSASIRTFGKPAAVRQAYRQLPQEVEDGAPARHIVEIRFTRLPGDAVMVVDTGVSAHQDFSSLDAVMMAGMGSATQDLLSLMAQPRQWLTTHEADAMHQHALDTMLPLVRAASQLEGGLAADADLEAAGLAQFYATAARAAPAPSPASRSAPSLLQRLRQLGRKVEVMWGLHLGAQEQQTRTDRAPAAGSISVGARTDSEARIDW